MIFRFFADDNNVFFANLRARGRDESNGPVHFCVMTCRISILRTEDEEVGKTVIVAISLPDDSQ